MAVAAAALVDVVDLLLVVVCSIFRATQVFIANARQDAVEWELHLDPQTLSLVCLAMA